MEKTKRVYRSTKKESYYSAVIRMHYEEGQGYKTIARKIPVNLCTIKNWCATFEAERTQKELIMEEQRKPEVQVESMSELEMQEEISRLREALDLERLRSEAYDEMIKLAETRFNIPIRKKSGTKR